MLGGALRKGPTSRLLSLLGRPRFALEMQRLYSALRFSLEARRVLRRPWPRSGGDATPQTHRASEVESLRSLLCWRASLQRLPPNMACERELCATVLVKFRPHHLSWIC